MFSHHVRGDHAAQDTCGEPDMADSEGSVCTEISGLALQAHWETADGPAESTASRLYKSG